MKKTLIFLLIMLMLLSGCSSKKTTGKPDSDKIIIALLDTGVSTDAIQTEHLLTGYNYVTDTIETEDQMNHGTAVASIIVGCETAGVAGIAPDALLVPLTVVDRCDGAVKSVSPDVLAQAVRDAVDRYHADIINISLGIKKDTNALRDAAAYAEENGVLIVSAVGNDGAETDRYYPASYDTVLSVGSHDKNGAVSDFSQQNGTVDLLAPGEKLELASRNGVAYRAKGTSYASGYVAAEAARLLQHSPNLTPAEVRNTFFSAATDIGDTGRDNESGWGVLNPDAVLPE